MHTSPLKLSTAPAVLVYRDDLSRALTQGTVVLYHGLGASKEIQSSDLANLASYGFAVVGVDNVGHGERRYSDFDERFAEENPQRVENIITAVLETAQEVPHLVDELASRGLFLEGKLGVAGISMGGFITYRAVLEEERFAAAVALLASPKWPDSFPQSPHLHLEKFPPLPLASLTAGGDRTVPPGPTRQFHLQLEELYRESPERIHYEEAPCADHFMPQKAWNTHWLSMVNWFKRWLSSS